jgi:acetylglutamate kinase
MMKNITIVKIGGEVLQDAATLSHTLHEFSRINGPKILVHGGGREVNDLSLKMGVEPKIVEGRRITDAFQLELAVMLYSGKINTQLVAQLSALGTVALGISGADLNVITCEKRPVTKIDYGFVGDVIQVNTGALVQLLNQGICPVVCSITSDRSGQLLNTNADTIATEIAKGLSQDYEVQLDLLMGPAGVLTDLNAAHSLIDKLSYARYERLRSEGILSAGILPKLQNAFEALHAGVYRVRIGNIGLLTEQKGTELCL